ncbi:hypothetical protein B5X24_HaOG209873 [Helicoverpa armigera]|nr:hypothetical protein B5X24_HaOG209873 [Helicoverpa armigera]
MRHEVMSSMVPDDMHRSPKMEVELEDALEFAGTGRYQVVHNFLMLFSLFAAIIEMIGIAFVLPAASCDLDVPDSLKGILTSLPNIGIILTAPFWGRAADSLGRKPVLLGSLVVSGVMAFAAAFMPNLVSFALLKFACSLFISCPSSLGYAYVSEMLPRRRRDFAVLITNGLINLLTFISPGLAWLILSYDWQYQFGIIDLRPWRLLTAVYAAPLLVSALCLLVADESPKFLMTRGNDKEALAILRKIYTVNTGLPEESFCVKSLKTPCDINDSEQRGSESALAPKTQQESAFALLRPPHLKWFSLTAFLMFGLFSFLNGLFLFAPDTINKVMSSPETTGTVCELMGQVDNSVECIDEDIHTYSQHLSALHDDFKTRGTAVGAVLMFGRLGSVVGANAAGVSLSAACMTTFYGFAGLVFFTAFQNTKSEKLTLMVSRGTAVGAVLMFGRLGSVVGANAAGVSLSAACMTTFYGFAGLVFLCAGLSFLLPPDQVTKPQEVDRNS